ncbi:unnamed protein product [Gadus morhua 'NCC']
MGQAPDPPPTQRLGAGQCNSRAPGACSLGKRARCHNLAEHLCTSLSKEQRQEKVPRTPTTEGVREVAHRTRGGGPTMARVSPNLGPPGVAHYDPGGAPLWTRGGGPHGPVVTMDPEVAHYGPGGRPLLAREWCPTVDRDGGPLWIPGQVAHYGLFRDSPWHPLWTGRLAPVDRRWPTGTREEVAHYGDREVPICGPGRCHCGPAVATVDPRSGYGTGGGPLWTPGKVATVDRELATMGTGRGSHCGPGRWPHCGPGKVGHYGPGGGPLWHPEVAHCGPGVVAHCGLPGLGGHYGPVRWHLWTREVATLTEVAPL